MPAIHITSHHRKVPQGETSIDDDTLFFDVQLDMNGKMTVNYRSREFQRAIAGNSLLSQYLERKRVRRVEDLQNMPTVSAQPAASFQRPLIQRSRTPTAQQQSQA